jgi:hypothetical protein
MHVLFEIARIIILLNVLGLITVKLHVLDRYNGLIRLRDDILPGFKARCAGTLINIIVIYVCLFQIISVLDDFVSRVLGHMLVLLCMVAAYQVVEVYSHALIMLYEYYNLSIF